MMQTELLTQRAISTIGEEITHELGAQMIKDYQKANSAGNQGYIIGQDILTQILAQPGCVGIKVYDALNTSGKKTLVCVGLDTNGKAILEYTIISTKGELIQEAGIVANRFRTPDGKGDDDNWWEVD